MCEGEEPVDDEPEERHLTATADFVSFLQARHKLPVRMQWRWRGHAYLVSTPPRRHVVDDGVVLVGDAAGLACPSGGEGTRPAVESGVMAARAILAADHRYERANLQPYEQQLRDRFKLESEPSGQQPWRTTLAATLATWFFDARWLVRHQVLDRWFLRAGEPPLAVMT